MEFWHLGPLTLENGLPYTVCFRTTRLPHDIEAQQGLTARNTDPSGVPRRRKIRCYAASLSCYIGVGPPMLRMAFHGDIGLK